MDRLFFALWPDPAAAAALDGIATQLAPALGGKATPREKLHITLVFLGPIAVERVDAAVAAGHEVGASPFAVTLDRLGAFRRAKVAWAGSAQPEPKLVELQQRLAGALAARGFSLEERPFSPHLTLVRGIDGAVPPTRIDAIAWHATQFRLMRSSSGTGRYATLETFRLRGG